MRILKLSPVDPEMKDRESVIRYFTKVLWENPRRGRFGLTPAKAKMRGIEKGVLLLFTYKKECMFLARAAGAIRKDRKKYSFPVIKKSLVRVSGCLNELEAMLRRKIRLKKNLVHTQSWPTLGEDADREAECFFEYIL